MWASPISTSFVNPYQAQAAAAFKQRGQDFTALGDALQSGDLAGAQQAFAALKKDTQTIQSAKPQQRQPFEQNSPVSRDFKMLERALDSDDLSGAQKSFATLQQDLQTARKSHRPHVHQTSPPQNPTQSDNDADGVNSDPSTGTNTNLTA